eukprot:762866-Hanusia_phi.AAC.1
MEHFSISDSVRLIFSFSSFYLSFLTAFLLFPSVSYMSRQSIHGFNHAECVHVQRALLTSLPLHYPLAYIPAGPDDR